MIRAKIIPRDKQATYIYERRNTLQLPQRACCSFSLPKPQPSRGTRRCTGTQAAPCRGVQYLRRWQPPSSPGTAEGTRETFLGASGCSTSTLVIGPHGATGAAEERERERGGVRERDRERRCQCVLVLQCFILRDRRSIAIYPKAKVGGAVRFRFAAREQQTTFWGRWRRRRGVGRVPC